MLRILPVVTALVVVIGAGVAHALLTDRWKLSAEPAASAARLPNVATQIGDWQGGDLRTLDSQAVGMGEIAGYVSRLYTNRQTGQVIDATLVCGRPGPIWQHTPDICYGGEGFKSVGGLKRHTLDLKKEGATVEFTTTVFQKDESGVPVLFRVFWTWGAAGKWHTPNNPRWTFGKYPALYKLYLRRQLSREDEKLEDDPCLDFARVLMPELQRALFPGS